LFSNASQATFSNTVSREIGMAGDSFGLLVQLIASISQVAMFLHVGISRPEPTFVKYYFVLTPTNHYFHVSCGVCRD